MFMSHFALKIMFCDGSIACVHVLKVFYRFVACI